MNLLCNFVVFLYVLNCVCASRHWLCGWDSIMFLGHQILLLASLAPVLGVIRFSGLAPTLIFPSSTFNQTFPTLLDNNQTVDNNIKQNATKVSNKRDVAEVDSDYGDDGTLTQDRILFLQKQLKIVRNHSEAVTKILEKHEMEQQKQLKGSDNKSLQEGPDIQILIGDSKNRLKQRQEMLFLQKQLTKLKQESELMETILEWLKKNQTEKNQVIKINNKKADYFQHQFRQMSEDHKIVSKPGVEYALSDEFSLKKHREAVEQGMAEKLKYNYYVERSTKRTTTIDPTKKLEAELALIEKQISEEQNNLCEVVDPNLKRIVNGFTKQWQYKNDDADSKPVHKQNTIDDSQQYDTTDSLRDGYGEKSYSEMTESAKSNEYFLEKPYVYINVTKHLQSKEPQKSSEESDAIGPSKSHMPYPYFDTSEAIHYLDKFNQMSYKYQEKEHSRPHDTDSNHTPKYLETTDPLSYENYKPRARNKMDPWIEDVHVTSGITNSPKFTELPRVASTILWIVQETTELQTHAKQSEEREDYKQTYTFQPPGDVPIEDPNRTEKPVIILSTAYKEKEKGHDSAEDIKMYQDVTEPHNAVQFFYEQFGKPSSTFATVMYNVGGLTEKEIQFDIETKPPVMSITDKPFESEEPIDPPPKHLFTNLGGKTVLIPGRFDGKKKVKDFLLDQSIPTKTVLAPPDSPPRKEIQKWVHHSRKMKQMLREHRMVSFLPRMYLNTPVLTDVIE